MFFKTKFFTFQGQKNFLQYHVVYTNWKFSPTPNFSYAETFLRLQFFVNFSDFKKGRFPPPVQKKKKKKKKTRKNKEQPVTNDYLWYRMYCILLVFGTLM